MKKITYLVSLILCLFLVACSDDVKKLGDSPGDTATAYFDALYNQQDLQKATTMATPNLTRIMKSYGTAKQFTRNLVNMQYDEVVIEVDMTNMSVREQYGDNAKINLIFTGYINGNKIDDMRSVKMLRKKGKWYIDKIVADPYAR
jgi:opacity protein-like surface antigen